jgi:hypothetical protein
VALLNEFVDISARKSALEQENDVLDHVLVRDKVKELRERLHGLRTQVLELGDELSRKYWEENEEDDEEVEDIIIC